MGRSLGPFSPVPGSTSTLPAGSSGVSARLLIVALAGREISKDLKRFNTAQRQGSMNILSFRPRGRKEARTRVSRLEDSRRSSLQPMYFRAREDPQKQ